MRTLTRWIALVALVLSTWFLLPVQAQSGQALIQNLLNQIRTGTINLGNMRVRAGIGTAAPHPGGTLYWENPSVSTTAGTVGYVTGTAYPIPASTLATNGDRLLYDIVVSIPTAAAADNKNLTCNIGYSSFNTTTGAFTGGLTINAQSSASNAGQLHWHSTVEVTRLGATSTGVRWYVWWESGAANTTTTQSLGWTTSSALTWANAMNTLCAVGNVTGGNTQVLTLQEWRITYDPR